jgi:hypothetical protein
MNQRQAHYVSVQAHLWPCAFLLAEYDNGEGLQVGLYETPRQETPTRAWFCSSDCWLSYVRLGPITYRTWSTPAAVQRCSQGPSSQVLPLPLSLAPDLVEDLSC